MGIFTHVVLGANDVAQSRKFYDAALAPLGIKNLGPMGDNAFLYGAQGPEFLTPGQLKCMLGAKSQEEVLKCLPQGKKNLVVRAGLDVSGYTDTNAVNVISPSINAAISSPTSASARSASSSEAGACATSRSSSGLIL